MAEVTKVCPGCGGFCDSGDCNVCSGTGRVPFDAAAEWGRFTAEQQEAFLQHALTLNPELSAALFSWYAKRLGPDGSWAALSPQLRLAMAKAAPKVAGRWLRDGDEWKRRGTDWNFTVWSRGDGTWANSESDDHSPDADAAQAACDAELLRLGYVLDDGEGM